MREGDGGTMADLLFKDELYRVMGAALEVYNVLKSGFLESAYREAMELELEARGIPYQRQVPLRIRYKEHTLNKGFTADLICFNAVLVELKAIEKTTETDEAQVLNYLRCTGLRVGLLINFGDPGRLDWKRLVH
jgi:GxxExxY protein